MEQKIEGLIIDKMPWRERDLLCHLLLRSGRKISVIFYGGQGGGTKKKSSLLELGHMLKIELAPSHKPDTEIYTAKEWGADWVHKKIRENHQAFYLLCFFLEVVGKLAPQDNLHDPHRDFDQSFEDLFRVLSNAVFYLEKSVEERQFSMDQHFFLFIAKILLSAGVFPQLGECHFCHCSLSGPKSLLLIAEGGFACENCLQHAIPDGEQNLHEDLHRAIGFKYSQYAQVLPLPINTLKALFDYFCYQMHLAQNDFKTLSFIFPH